MISRPVSVFVSSMSIFVLRDMSLCTGQDLWYPQACFYIQVKLATDLCYMFELPPCGVLHSWLVICGPLSETRTFGIPCLLNCSFRNWKMVGEAVTKLLDFHKVWIIVHLDDVIFLVKGEHVNCKSAEGKIWNFRCLHWFYGVIHLKLCTHRTLCNCFPYLTVHSGPKDGISSFS